MHRRKAAAKTRRICTQVSSALRNPRQDKTLVKSIVRRTAQPHGTRSGVRHIFSILGTCTRQASIVARLRSEAVRPTHD